jgi:glycosyltransferase involved in cell wall biosynthesis
VNTLLSINNYYYYRGGAETVFLEHNRMFDAAGWRVVPFSMWHPRNLASPWVQYFVEEIEFGESYSLMEKLRRVPKVIYSLEARQKLSRLIDTIEPRICHAHNIYHHISPSILGLLHARGVPTVMTLHDLKVACPAYQMLTHDGVCERCKGGRLHNVLVNRCIQGSRALSAIVMVESMLHRMLGSYSRCVNLFIVPSRFYIEKLCEWGMPRAQFEHVPNPVDTKRFVPRFTPGQGFVYFGRLSREKGLATLIRAAAAAKVRVRIAGTGQMEQSLRALAAELAAPVEFVGFVRGSQLHDLVGSARAVVLPSEWYENAPMSVLESYALGKPVIGANIGGIPELIRQGLSGYIFPSGDVAALADTLRRMEQAPDADVEAMGRHARGWVDMEFTDQRYFERTLAIYNRLGAAAPAHPAGSIPNRSAHP